VTESQSILDGLRSDHQAIAEALAEPAPTDDAAERAQLVMMLVRHFVAEEQYLHPLIREHVTDGEDVAEQQFTRDRAIEQRLKELESDELTPPALIAVWDDVSTAFADHVLDQDAIFDALEQQVDAARLAELGADVRGSEQLAPTRPRASATDSPRANKVASLIEGFVDHVRDSYSHRGVERD
jgi:hypothetical protein